MITIDNARSVSSLLDAEVNALLDEHLFDHRQLCLGHSERDESGVYRCVWCAAIDDRAIASRVFDMQPWHRREAQSYTIAEIVEKMNQRSEDAQVDFVRSLKSQILDGTSSVFMRTPLAEFVQVVMNLTLRRVGIAALEALEIIDKQGYVRES